LVSCTKEIWHPCPRDHFYDFLFRFFARSCPQLNLYGSDAQSKTEVDHWLSFTVGPLASEAEFERSVAYLDSVLKPITVLVGEKLTIADYVVFGSLFTSGFWQVMKFLII
jgi:glutathione S-transferase